MTKVLYKEPQCKLNIIGIDPGLLGACAFLYEDQTIRVFDTPILIEKKRGKLQREYQIQKMAEIIEQNNEGKTIAAIENVHAFKDQGVHSVFHFGKGFGIWLGILSALKIPYQLITPQSWKKQFGLLGTEKDAARLYAQKLFSQVDLSLKKYSGRADALLIAEYLRETYV